MRLFSRLLLAPSSRGDGTDDRLTAGMDVDMLHRDLLLPLAAITLERLDLRSEGAQQLYCEAPIPVPLEERLRILEAAKRRDAGGMRRYHLCRQHPLGLVRRADTRYRRQYPVDVTFARLPK